VEVSPRKGRRSVGRGVAQVGLGACVWAEYVGSMLGAGGGKEYNRRGDGGGEGGVEVRVCKGERG